MATKRKIRIYYHTGVSQQSGSFEKGTYKKALVEEIANDIIIIDDSADDFIKELRDNNDWYHLQRETGDQLHHSYVKVFQVDFLGFVD